MAMRPEPTQATGTTANLSIQRRRVSILGLPVDDVVLDDVVNLVHEWCMGGARLYQIVTLNPEMVMAARRRPAFRTVLEQAALVTPDGVGIVLAARFCGTPLRGRVTGVDLLEAVARTTLSLFLLGAAPGVAEKAASFLRRRYGAQIVGTWAGSPSERDTMYALEQITARRPAVLCVAYGAPAQDLWIAHYREALTAAGVRVAIGVGGALDYLAGVVPRPPRFVRQAGMEWLYRLLRQPWRWRRQLALPQFAALAILEALQLRLVRRD